MPVCTDHLLLLKKFGRCGAVSGKKFSTDPESTEQKKLSQPRGHTNMPMCHAHQRYEFENVDIATPTH